MGLGTRLIDRLIPEYVRSYSPTLVKWLLIGYLFRLFFMPITAHSDMVNNGFQATILSSQGYWLPSSNSPFYYFLYAGWLKLFQPIMPMGIFWDISSHINFGTDPNQGIVSLLLRLSDPPVYSFLFISKVLFLIPDFIVAITLLHLFDKPAESLFAFKFWMINPMVIFVTYVVGQFDVFVAVFLTLALLAVYKRRYLDGTVYLGIGAAFKISLLIFLPLILLPLARQKRVVLKFKETAIGIALSALPLVLSYLSVTLVPVRMASYNLDIYTPSFSVFGLFLSRLITFTTTSGFDDYLFAFFLFYFLFIIFYYLKGDYQFDSFWKVSLGILLFYFALSFFHPQWFLWVQPLLVITLAKYRRLLGLFAVTFVGFAGYLMYFNKALTTYLLLPLNSAIISLPGPIELLAGAGFPPSLVMGIFRTLLSAGCIGIAVFVLGERFLHRPGDNQLTEE